ncbi:hypothetical protein JMJ77_0007219 [Colletotrichum scovillei]|uniref:Uncharacterized protein n=1 Tax=Colletotrichum scovillei TaxID=1209932 RepID=A0A9P7UFM8_9PEZI|nr:hypothetical protein JMJ77_0007219 [Colletotrichum scovillei]KAG7074185.1 hypothetical protein JMJ76_0010671 [Colletotrichum scovillei]KAG7081350.1 hypothetical protein JMJ78_0003474 [Colletotrichum scovillei]
MLPQASLPQRDRNSDLQCRDMMADFWGILL